MCKVARPLDDRKRGNWSLQDLATIFKHSIHLQTNYRNEKDNELKNNHCHTL